MDLDPGHLQRKKVAKELVRAIDQLEKERDECRLIHLEQVRELEDLMGWTQMPTNQDQSDRIIKTRACCFKLHNTEEELQDTWKEVVRLQEILESLMIRKVTDTSFSVKVLEVHQACAEFKDKETKYHQLKKVIQEDESALRNLSGWKQSKEDDIAKKCEQVKEQCWIMNENESSLRAIEKRMVDLEGELDDLLTSVKPQSLESMSHNNVLKSQGLTISGTTMRTM